MTALSDGAMVALIEASAFSDSLPRQTAARLLLEFIRNGKDIEFTPYHLEAVRTDFGVEVERELSWFLDTFDLNQVAASSRAH